MPSTSDADRQDKLRLNSLKLAPPAAATEAISRDAVCSLICTTPATMVVLSAPAGFGKTTSMSQAYRRLKEGGTPVGWLTLDAADNDLGRLGIYLEAAVRAAAPELPSDGEDAGSPRGDFSGPSMRINRLLDDLPLVRTPFVLFIDEFEHLADPDALMFFDRLLTMLDVGQRLVVGSRTSPNLHLGRLRVQGRLLELDADVLRFSEEESREFLRKRLPAEPGESELRELHGQTEGWPAALQLATTAVLLRKSGTRTLPRDLPGSIADYLAEDVIARLPDELRSFLLRSSLFDEFCPAMCDHVLEIADSEHLIQRIVASNLFLNRIDADGDWYRYHPLFHDFLRRECERQLRSQLPSLHRRAAQWLSDAGRTGAAINQAFAAADHELAADLIAKCGAQYVRAGLMTAMRNWIAQLPESCLDSRPKLIIAGAYANTYLHKYADAGRLVAKLDAFKETAGDIADDILLIKIMLAAWTDNLAEGFRLAVANQDRMETSDPYVIGLIQNVIAYMHVFRGYYYFAHQSLATAKRAFVSIGGLHGLSYSSWLEGTMSLIQGDAGDAYARASGSLNQVIAEGHKYSSSSPVAAANLMEVLYETNELQMIDPLVQDYLPIIRETCLPDQIIISHRVAARTLVLQGQHGRALEVLNALQDLGDARSIPRFPAAARMDRIWIALLAGDVATANRLTPLITPDYIWKPFEGLWTCSEDIEDAQMVNFRCAIVAGNAASVTAKIETAIRDAEAANRRRRVLRLQCLLAQCHELARRRPKALELLERALAIAQPLGLVRVFADESWCLTPLLEALATRSTVVSGDYVNRIIAATRLRPVPGGTPGWSEQPADSLLSPRERQILALLAEGLSNKELASKTLVAESTIETYLHRINTKLGTRNRTQAVARGRELHLI